MYGPSTFQLTYGGTAYTIWYSSYLGNIFYDCLIISGGTSLNISSSFTVDQVTITDNNIRFGDIGSTLSIGSNVFTITAVDPVRLFVINAATPNATGSGSLIINSNGNILYAYSGPLSSTTSPNNSPFNYAWLSVGSEIYPKSDIYAKAISNSSQDPSLYGATIVCGTQKIYNGANLSKIYYNMIVNLPNTPYPSMFSSYDTDNSLIKIQQPNGQPQVIGTAYSGNSTANTTVGKYITIPNNTVFTSDFYPLYDNTNMAGSTQALNGIGIRQPVAITRNSVSWNSGSVFISDASAVSSDLGCYVIDAGNILTPQTYISQVVVGVGYYVAFNYISYGYNLLPTGSSGYTNVTLIPFSSMQLIQNTSVPMSNIQYYVNKSVRDVDSVIQQQRLVGTSTLTHAANVLYFVINIVIVPSSNGNISSLPSQLQTTL
jgi:hypothetical protein